MKVRKQNKFKNRNLKLVSWFEFHNYFKPEVEFCKRRYYVASNTLMRSYVGCTKRRAYNWLFNLFKLAMRYKLKTNIVTDNGKLFKIKDGESTVNGVAKIVTADLVFLRKDKDIA